MANGRNPWGAATLQEKVSPGLADSYRSEASLGGGSYANYSDFSAMNKSDSDRSSLASLSGYGGGV